MSFIKFWNKLRYWQRGAMIGFVLCIMFVFLFSLWINFVSFKSAEPVSFWAAFIILFAVYVIPATIAGLNIGWMIGKFIKK